MLVATLEDRAATREIEHTYTQLEAVGRLTIFPWFLCGCPEVLEMLDCPERAHRLYGESSEVRKNDVARERGECELTLGRCGLGASICPTDAASGPLPTPDGRL